MTVLVSTHYMDEAERCHRIAYISYGRLLTEGTIAEVLARSGLVTWQARGAGGRRAWPAALRGQPGVEMVAPFGSTLHVSGTDRRGTGGRDRALARRRRARLAARSRPRWRTCSST